MPEENQIAGEATEVVLETGRLVSVVYEKLEGWLTDFAAMLPNLAVAVLVVVVFGLAGRVASNLVRRALVRTRTNDQVTGLLTVLTRVGLIGVGLFVALGLLQLDKTVTSLLAGVGVIGLALGFAFQDIAANFMSGVIMAIREPFQLGDVVETHGTMGTVERLTLRATVLRNFFGQLVIIPNKDVLQNAITNYTQSGVRRVEIEVGVSYGDDLELAERAARRALEELDERDEAKPVDVFFTGFGDSSINMSLRFWLDLKRDGSDFLTARSRGVKAIKRAFDAEGITIPFPIRTLDFGIVGGETLAEMLDAKEAASG